MATRVWRAASAHPETWSKLDLATTVMLRVLVLERGGPDPANLFDMQVSSVGGMKDDGPIDGVGDACHGFSQPREVGGVLLRVRSGRLLVDVYGPNRETGIRFARYAVRAFTEETRSAE